MVCKETSDKILYRQIETFKLANSHKTINMTKMYNGKKQFLVYNFINELLLTGSDTNNVEVNWCELIITNSEGKRLHCFSFVTDLKITPNNVQEIVEAGRTRWKIENKNNNTLKTKGYNLEHNFGHGKQYLAQNLCSLNILAFLFHTIQELYDEAYSNLRSDIGSRKSFFEAINVLTTMFTFKSFDKLIDFISLFMNICLDAIP